MHDMGRAPEYTCDQLQYLQSDYHGRWQVDDAIVWLGDASLGPEVLDELQASVKHLKDDMFAHTERCWQSVCHLVWAHAIRWIQDEHETDVGMMTVPNWVVERGHSC